MERLSLEHPDTFDYRTIEPGDIIFLTAAISSPDICAREHHRAWDVNVIGTSKFISRALERGGRAIFLSSDTVYGNRPEEFDEHAASSPLGEYAEMKHEVEQRFTGNQQFKAVRLSYVFSRLDKFTTYLRGCAEREECAELFHPFYRAIVHREDVLDGLFALATRWEEIPEEIINFGGPATLSRITFAETLQSTVLPNLKFSVVEPSEDFFSNRPKAIRMASPIFHSLLGREPRSLVEAIGFEFERK